MTSRLLQVKYVQSKRNHLEAMILRMDSEKSQNKKEKKKKNGKELAFMV